MNRGPPGLVLKPVSAITLLWPSTWTFLVGQLFSLLLPFFLLQLTLKDVFFVEGWIILNSNMYYLPFKI